MVLELTPAERRGAMVVVCLFALGAGWDLWRTRHPRGEPLGAVPAPAPTATAPARADSAAPAGAPVDLNRASAEELDALPGIGPVLAKRIVEHRRLHGPFGRPEDLMAVRGIGPRSFARLRPRVTAGSGPAPPAPASAGRPPGGGALHPARRGP